MPPVLAVLGSIGTGIGEVGSGVMSGLEKVGITATGGTAPSLETLGVTSTWGKVGAGLGELVAGKEVSGILGRHPTTGGAIGGMVGGVSQPPLRQQQGSVNAPLITKLINDWFDRLYGGK
jgi:hypothetical protein